MSLCLLPPLWKIQAHFKTVSAKFLSYKILFQLKNWNVHFHVCSKSQCSLGWNMRNKERKRIKDGPYWTDGFSPELADVWTDHFSNGVLMESVGAILGSLDLCSCSSVHVFDLHPLKIGWYLQFLSVDSSTSLQATLWLFPNSILSITAPWEINSCILPPMYVGVQTTQCSHL